MIADFMPLFHDPFGDLRVFLHMSSYHEESGRDIILFKNIQDGRSEFQAWPVVKGQCNHVRRAVAAAVDVRLVPDPVVDVKSEQPKQHSHRCDQREDEQPDLDDAPFGSDTQNLQDVPGKERQDCQHQDIDSYSYQYF